MPALVNHSQNENCHLKPVPLSARRSALTMGLVWMTMVTSFPALLAGYEWYRQGITLDQLILGAVISLLLLLAYSIPACELGARSGLGYSALGQTIFGRLGGMFLTTNLLLVFTAWYGLTAVLMAQSAAGLFHWQLPVIWLSVAFALLMSVNNLFGFTGVANFARFLAAPVLIVWVGYIFLKALNMSDPPVNPEPIHPSFLQALSVTSSFIIGFAVWGNEQDYWRFSKPGIWRSAIPLTISITVGLIVFPLAGWLIAHNGAANGATATTAFMSNYCFGGIALIGLLTLIADYFSTNDSSLFGCASAMTSIYPLKHNLAAGIFAAAGALVAAFIAVQDAAQTLAALVSLNCIILPTPTIIMLTEWFLKERIFRDQASYSLVPNFDPVSNFSQLPAIRWPALVALLAGLTVGIVTSGLIPGLEFYHVGICSLQAWLTSILVYLPLRIYEYSSSCNNKLVISQELNKSEEAEPIFRVRDYIM